MELIFDFFLFNLHPIQFSFAFYLHNNLLFKL